MHQRSRGISNEHKNLSIALLFISFKSRSEMLKNMLVLSPFAMTILVMMGMTIISLATARDAVPSIDLRSTIKDSTELYLLVEILALAWGYICVGLGLGGYKLLQHFGIIKEEEKINSGTIAVNSQV